MKGLLKCDESLILQVTLFDKFQIIYGNTVIDEEDIKSDMVTKLLAYMICHREKNVSLQELTDVLWGDEEIDNPAGALKNLIYRLRKILKQLIGDYTFIETGRGFYKWNKEILIYPDTEQFEIMCKKSKAEIDINKRVEYEKKAAVLYKQKFLPQYIDEYWVVSLNVYYHSLYLNTVKRLLEDLDKTQNYSEMEEVCHRAVLIDELDEDLHCYYIEALIKQNKNNIALENYRKTSDLFYEQLGVRPSEKMRRLYDKLLEKKHTKQMNISVIKKELSDSDNEQSGAFMCEYGIFKKDFELEVRRARRQGGSVYLALLTVNPMNGFKPGSVTYNSTVGLGIQQLQDILLESLRAGDVITRYSVEQFIIMLPTCNYENAAGVMTRVMDNYQNQVQKAKVKIEYSLEKI